nr:pyroglutamyl-peptidase I [Anaerolineae bacterium]
MISKVLLTAFEPFGGRQLNASKEALHALTIVHAPLSYLDIRSRVLPVAAGRAGMLLIATITETRPDYVVCLGEAKRDAVCLETRAFNERRFTIPDNEGNRPEDEAIIPGGPDWLASSLPFEEMLPAMQATGIPARFSDDAGRYLCNEVLYQCLHFIRDRGLAIRAGFIHVPLMPEAVEAGQPCLPTPETVRAIAAGLG